MLQSLKRIHPQLGGGLLERRWGTRLGQTQDSELAGVLAKGHLSGHDSEKRLTFPNFPRMYETEPRNGLIHLS